MSNAGAVIPKESAPEHSGVPASAEEKPRVARLEVPLSEEPSSEMDWGYGTPFDEEGYIELKRKRGVSETVVSS
ncbi:MAG: hypothetical protein BWY68_00032 [bacterium ADurb.Bin400]|nr:MAG: hypothetical protein BWY68_00032 [bacterium ADurb.Bin400]